ncbi:MAG: amidohydrolase family protein [Candidatus Glassbacteria bacterium]
MVRNLLIAAIFFFTLAPPLSSQYPVSPSSDNTEREQGDGGFSRGFGDTNHAWSFDWFDSHLHLAYSHFPNVLKGSQIQEVMDRWFNLVGVYQCGRAILLDPYLETMEWAKDDPRLYVFWWLEWDQADQLPEIKRRAEAGLIQGLKLHTGDFRRQKNPDYRVMGSPAWHQVYDYCESAGLPVLIHVNEHWGDQRYAYGRGAKAFWARAGYTNQELLDYFLKELVAKHPGVKWVVAHMNFQGIETLSRLFDRYPNLYVDTSIGMYLREFDRLTPEEIKPYRDFCIKYADRLLFGTDGFAYQPLESSYAGHVRNWWLPHHIFIASLGLPQETLDAITHGTCEKVLGRYLKRPAGAGQ